MELTPGYKHTEMGVIPNEWEVKPLRDLKLEISDGNYSSKYPKSSDFRRIGVPFIRANNIKNMTVIDDDMRFISKEQHQELKKGHLKATDVIITTRGEIGQLALVPTSHIDSNINAQLVRINPGSTDVDHRFLAQAISEGKAQTQLANLQTGSALKQLPVGRLVQLRLAFPPPTEQRAIATALTDVDALIAGLERLIVKKRDIKQAAMQQLLTGQTRLPGFSGEWDYFRVAELEKLGLLRLGRGNVISKKDIDATPGDCPIYSSSVKNDGEFGRYGHFMFDEELITWSVDGGGNFFYRSKHRFSVTNVCGYMRADPMRLNYRYLAAQLQFEHGKKSFDYQSKAHPSVVRSEYLIPIPKIEEQTAIAIVLSNMEADLATLESRLIKTRAIKQGMMQELLTGRTRLV